MIVQVLTFDIFYFSVVLNIGMKSGTISLSLLLSDKNSIRSTLSRAKKICLGLKKGM